MNGLFLFGASILILCVLLYMGGVYAKPNRNVMLGVTLPREAQADPEVLARAGEYRRKNRRLCAFLLLAAVPGLAFFRYLSLSLLYLFVWLFAAMALDWRLRYHTFQDAMALKSERGWFCGSPRIVSADTAVSRAKAKMPLSGWWLVPALLPGFLAFWLFPARERYGLAVYFIAVLPVLLTVIMLLTGKLYTAQRALVYSGDTQVNLQCNYIYQRGWSVCWVVFSYLMNFFWFLSVLGILQRNYIFAVASLAGILLAAVLCPAVTQSQVRERQNRLLACCRSPVYMDDDVYWARGYYYNPNDRRMNVPKRDGSGFTLNLGSRRGKTAAWATGALLVLLVIGSFFAMPLDTGEIRFTVENDGAAVTAPYQSLRFSLDEVKEVRLLERFPTGMRTAGASTDRVNLGWFYLDGVGSCRVYAYTGPGPALLIQLNSGPLVINGKTGEQTREYEALLRAALAQRQHAG